MSVFRAVPQVLPVVSAPSGACRASNRRLSDLGVAPVIGDFAMTIPLRCRACGATIQIRLGSERMPEHPEA